MTMTDWEQAYREANVYWMPFGVKKRKRLVREYLLEQRKRTDEAIRRGEVPPIETGLRWM